MEMFYIHRIHSQSLDVDIYTCGINICNVSHTNRHIANDMWNTIWFVEPVYLKTDCLLLEEQAVNLHKYILWWIYGYIYDTIRY